jgi:hypothetical protein
VSAASSFGQPAGIPISRAILLPPGPLGDVLRPALDAIDRVHGEGVLPQLAVAVEPRLADESSYVWAAPQGIALGIALRPDAPHPRLNLLHEVGHFLDHQAIDRVGIFASVADARFADWRRAVVGSEATRRLMTIARRADRPKVGDYATYLLRTEELWARSYAQCVTVASEDIGLRGDLDERRRHVSEPGSIPVQWGDDDFRPIAASILDLFQSLGWTA